MTAVYVRLLYGLLLSSALAKLCENAAALIKVHLPFVVCYGFVTAQNVSVR